MMANGSLEDLTRRVGALGLGTLRDVARKIRANPDAELSDLERLVMHLMKSPLQREGLSIMLAITMLADVEALK